MANQDQDVSGKLKRLRREYGAESLDVSSAAADPFDLFDIWFNQAIQCGTEEPNAMALATASESIPSVRTVLLKDYSREGMIFYTNYGSAKGRDLDVNPRAEALFYWPVLVRQVRVAGAVRKVSAEESDRYFKTRPAGAQIAAVVSRQSQAVESRAVLERAWQDYFARSGADIRRPDYWGGYILLPDKYEFWQGRDNRLHDRLLYTLKGAQWQICRLAP
ncbi:MAG: pyridoxamine 5'-phosphate oxidase [Deltaproteobacteria bacterium]|nr:pyridoxamine 5'-phosphate oxidase [Deltaproteobacteria bacterium]